MLDFSPLIYTPRILTATSEWLACFVYIFILKSKLSKCKLILLASGSLVVLVLYHLFIDKLPLSLWIPGMIGAFLLMSTIIHFATSTGWKDTFFCGIRSFLLAEFNTSFHWHFYVWIAIRLGIISKFWWYISAPPAYILIVVLYFLIERNNISNEKPLNVSNRDLLFGITTTLIIFAISNLSFVTLNTPFSIEEGSILYVRMLLDFGGLVLLYEQQNKREELRIKLEQQAISSILQSQYEQYKLAVANGEQLHRELHDLKHYMLAIRTETNPEKKLQYLTEIEEAIQIQETFSTTGNSVLDTILTAKSNYCLQHDIHLTCMADGKLLNAIHVKDICSIVGNALDNAIECVIQYPDSDKRYINFTIMQRNHFVLISCENYSELSIDLPTDSLPPTSKADSRNHGYGLKCIKTCVQKYDGSITIHNDNHQFSLQALIPLR